MKKISILIVEDQVLVRHFFRMTLNVDPRFTVVSETGSGEEAVQLTKLLQPNIVLMDVDLEGMDGMKATKKIKKESPDTKVLCVSSHIEWIYIDTMLKNGAEGYLTKTAGREDLYRAIMSVTAGIRYLCSAANHSLNDTKEANKKPGIESLSYRENQIVTMIRKGLTSKEIANALSLSPNTVEVHRSRIFKKLNIKNSAALVNLVTAA